jgi:hypothetical protein
MALVSVCELCPVRGEGCLCPLKGAEVPGNLFELVREAVSNSALAA